MALLSGCEGVEESALLSTSLLRRSYRGRGGEDALSARGLSLLILREYNTNNNSFFPVSFANGNSNKKNLIKDFH